MEVATVTVRLAGDLNMQIPRHKVTPPEVMLLRAIHGHDAVVDIKGIHMDRREHRAEKARLLERYDRKTVERLFPGVLPQLPVTFKDAEGVPDIEIEEADAVLDAAQSSPAEGMIDADAE